MKEFPDVEEKIKKVAKYRKDKLTSSMSQLAEELATTDHTKLNKKPLYKSTDYFYNVLMNHGNKKAGRSFGLQPAVNPSAFRKSLFSGITPQNKTGDHLETFKKLQDFTGAIDSKRSDKNGTPKDETTPKGVLKKKSSLTPKAAEKFELENAPQDNIIKGPLRRAYLPPLTAPKTISLGDNGDTNKAKGIEIL